jgi:peptidoglycan-associated lipoprotein
MRRKPMCSFGGGAASFIRSHSISADHPPAVPPPFFVTLNIAIEALRKDSTELRDILKDYPDYKLTIEGHCDERGSTEYNLALGDNRASAVKNALVSAGISADRIKTISYGKEKPFCTESTEACWQQNRRGHFVYVK